MATIGTFTKADNGNFTGTITTMTLKAKTTIRPVDKESDKAPDYRLAVGTVECGAGWKKTSRENRDYLSVKLDDPSFPAPIYATLVETDSRRRHRPARARRRLCRHGLCHGHGDGVGPQFRYRC